MSARSDAKSASESSPGKARTTSDLVAGNVAVVTGAASGIGRALALDFAARGMRLALADRDEAGLAETAAMLGGADVLSEVFDVSDGAAFLRFAARVHERFGRADIVVNNAGVAIGGSVAELAIDEIAWIMDINFWGVVHGTKAFLPGLVAQKSGTIVNMSSLFGLWGPPLNAAYAASKFAVRGFSESLRGEMRAQHTGVRVVTVHPGGIKTNIAKRARYAAAADQELGRKRQAAFDASALTTTPEKAASVIVAGLEAGKTRVLINREVFVIDFLVRAFGGRGVEMANDASAKRLPPELRG